jgi:hypothetical protein
VRWTWCSSRGEYTWCRRRTRRALPGFPAGTADGDDVCLIYDLVTNTPAGTAPVAEWFRVRDGKIAQIRVFFDARPFAPPAGH